MQMNLSAEEATMLWNDVVEMAHDLPDTGMIPWLERLQPVSLANGTMTVATRQNWTAKKVMGEFRPQVEALLAEITLEPIALDVVVTSAVAAPAAPAPAAGVPSPTPVSETAAEPTTFHVKHDDLPPASEQTLTAETPRKLSPAALAGAAVAAGKGNLFPTGFPPSPAPHPATPAPTGAPSFSAGVAAASTPQAPEGMAPSFEPLVQPETIAQEDVAIPILEEGTIPKAAVATGYASFSFDTYIVGEANSLAYNTARAVAEQPGALGNPNPLFIHGPSGNGKTHLLLSILNYLRAHQPLMNVQYIAANAFVDQYIEDIRSRRLHGKDVLRKYRDVDVLLVDDVQMFQDKQESVSTFFDIFNQLILDGKQIVLAADRAPDYLTLDERMRTRFGSGLVVDVKAPTYEMKRSILVSFYERARHNRNLSGVVIPANLFDTMVQYGPSTPRHIQGFINTVMFKASEDPSVLTVDGIKRVIEESYKVSVAPELATIVKTVCSAYGVSADEVKGSGRKKNISEARQVIMWMARQLTEESYVSIGHALGGRDHSTVYYGIQQVEKRLSDRAYFYKLEALKKEITG